MTLWLTRGVVVRAEREARRQKVRSLSQFVQRAIEERLERDEQERQSQSVAA